MAKIVLLNVHIVEKLTKNNLKKVLIISPNWIGDSIMAEPLFSHLKKEYDSHITILCPKFLLEIFEAQLNGKDLVLTPKQERVRKKIKEVSISRNDTDIKIKLVTPDFSLVVAAYRDQVFSALLYEDCITFDQGMSAECKLFLQWAHEWKCSLHYQIDGLAF